MLRIRKSRYSLIFNYTLLFFAGFMVFSPISSRISFEVLHLPLALPEILFVPFYFKFRKFFDLRINHKIFISGTVIIIILICIAFFVGQFPISSILSTTRGYFYMLVVFSVFKDKSIKNYIYIFYIVLGSSVGWAVLGLISFRNIISGLFFNSSGAVYGNMIALGLMVVIPIIFRKRFLILLSFLITVIISIVAGLRRQIVVVIGVYIFSLFTQLRSSVKRMISLVVSVSFFIGFLIIFFPVTENFIHLNSPLLYKRVFVKSEQLVSDNMGSADQSRIGHFYNFLDNMDNYIFPHGFVSKRTMQDPGAGVFMDSPYLELFYTFGIFFSIPIIIYFFYSIYFHFSNYYKREIRESAVCIAMGGVVLILMFIEGSFLNFVYTTPLTGFVFARIVSRKNLTA